MLWDRWYKLRASEAIQTRNTRRDHSCLALENTLHKLPPAEWQFLRVLTASLSINPNPILDCQWNAILLLSSKKHEASNELLILRQGFSRDERSPCGEHHSYTRVRSQFPSTFTRLGAIPDVIPIFRPLLAPGERAITDRADLRGQILFGRLTLDFSFAARHQSRRLFLLTARAVAVNIGIPMANSLPADP